MEHEARHRALSPLVRRTVVGLGVAIGAGTLAAPAQATGAAENRPTSPVRGDPSACPGTPTDGRTVSKRELLRLDNGGDVGDVILQYSPSLRCVRSVVFMAPPAPDCWLVAIVYKPSTGQRNGYEPGAIGATAVASRWVNDRGIQQKAIGEKWCYGIPFARGGTAVY